MNVLLESSIRAALIAAAVAAVARGLRIANPRMLHATWTGVLTAMLLLPAFLMWGPRATVRALPPAAEASVIERAVPLILPDLEPIDTPTVTPVPTASKVEPPIRREVWRMPSLLIMAYLLGAGFSLIRLLIGTRRAAAVLKRASPERDFFTSNECACPVTIGWRRPVVVLPPSWSDWPQTELDAVLAHEREHVRRRDPLVQWLAALNRCVYWFHPLAWWVERHLAQLAEQACDDAAVARGHDPHDYSDYLLHQARAIQQAGARLRIPGVAMGDGSLRHRIERLLEMRPARGLGQTKALAATALCTAVIATFTACRLDRVERPAAGQPTMNELMHRRADENRQEQEKMDALLEQAKALTPKQAQDLVDKLKQNPNDEDTYWTLVRHYEGTSNVRDLDALRLWYIEHQPAGNIWPGYIDPVYDRVAYEKGKALWLAHLKRPDPSIRVYLSAGSFLVGEDMPIAGSILLSGQRAYPNDKEWGRALGTHYARALFPSDPASDAEKAYSQAVRARLADSKDVPVLSYTAVHLMMAHNQNFLSDSGPDIIRLARTYIDQALAINPNLDAPITIKHMLTQRDRRIRATQLSRMPAPEFARVNDSDRMLLALTQMETAWRDQNLEYAGTKAAELLALAAHNQSDLLYGDAVFEGNIVLGKIALRAGDRKVAAQKLLAAADAPNTDQMRRAEFEMNLPRALIDRGERRAAAEFLERMAPKTVYGDRFLNWATQIRNGINPGELPTSSIPGCSHDPC